MAGTTAVILVNSYRYRHIQLDDAYIYGRYFKNLYAGHGLVFNPGVRFDGLTSPLYAWLMIAVTWMFPNPMQAALAVSTVGMIAAAWLMYRFGSLRGDGPAYALGLLVGFSMPYFYSTYGMETPLLLTLIAACLVLYQRQRYGLLAAAGGLLVLTRSEAGLLLVVLTIEHVIERRRRPSWKVLVAPVLLVGADLAFNLAYYGAALPGTGIAKVGQGESGLWGTSWPLFDQVQYFTPDYFLGHLDVALALAALALLGMASNPRRARPLFLFCALLTAFYCAIDVPDYNWYYAPLFFGFFCFVGAGLVRLGTLAARAARDDRSRAVAAWTVAVGLSVAIAGVSVCERSVLTPGDPRNAMNSEAGEWMAAHLPAGASVSAVEVGAAGYYSNQDIIDILGLVTPQNAQFIAERRFTEWLTVYHPDYYLVHDGFWPQEIAIKGLVVRDALWIDTSFPVGNMTMLCLPREPGCSAMTSEERDALLGPSA
jgi:arabinofuranosyltransferase